MTLQVKSRIDTTQAFHVYYNLDMMNNDISGEGNELPLAFKEVRSAPFLDNPSNYFLSVVRFSISTESIPSFIPQIKIGSADVNETIYKIGATSNIPAQPTYPWEYVEYEPQDKSATIPLLPTTSQDNSNTYYHVYNNEWAIYLLNVKLEQIFGNYVPDPAYVIEVPFFEFDKSTGRISFHFPESFLQDAILSTLYALVINAPLYKLLNGFTMTKYKADPAISGTDPYWKLFIPKNPKESTVKTGYYMIESDVSTNASFNPVQSLVFTTNLMPVATTNVSPAKLYNSLSRLEQNATTADLLPILTDFEVPVTGSNVYAPSVYYEPSGEYRLVDLIGNNPVSSININVYWKDFFGNINPLKLMSGGTANMKLMFRRKDFANVDLQI